MPLSDAKLRRLVEVTWDVAIETTFKARMKLIADAFRELVPYDMATSFIMDTMVMAGYASARASPALTLTPVESLFHLMPERHFFADNYPMEAAKIFAERYIQHDPVAPRATANPGTPIVLSRVIPKKLWGKEPFTGEFLPLIGMKHGVATAIPVREGLMTALSCWRSEKRKDFSKDDVKVEKVFQPIVARAALAALLAEKLAGSSDPPPTKPLRNGFALFEGSGELVKADAGGHQFLSKLARLPHGMDRVVADVLAVGRTKSTEESVERTILLADGSAVSVSATRVGREDAAVALLFQELTLGPDAAFGAAAARIGLSARECEVARMVVDGKGNKEIAFALEVSLETVKTHLKSVFRKAQVAGRAELVARLLGKTKV
jgi:DNA-binding CsgD family transcriptional regulator